MSEAKIANKAEYFRLAALGRMGNQMPSWATPDDAIADGYSGPVMVRYREPNSPYMRPDVPMADVPVVFNEFAAKGARRDLLYLTHMTASIRRRINGELWRGPGGLYLNYSTKQTNLRAGLEQDGRHVERSAAIAILRWACCPNSYDDLMILLDQYPDSVIEFTAYDQEIGDIKHRNVVVWECRSY